MSILALVADWNRRERRMTAGSLVWWVKAPLARRREASVRRCQRRALRRARVSVEWLRAHDIEAATRATDW
jgi:predicted nuclease with RNAse H fold